jgi:hypothetical protein
MRRVKGAVLAVVVLAGMVRTSPVQASIPSEQSSIAIYHDRKIDLSVSWEGAQACWIADGGNTCYDSEKEMDAAHGTLPGLRAIVPLSTCASSLRLYDNTSFGTPVLALNTSGFWVQLSTYSFSAKTSSYIVGVCNSLFADGAGTVYPGSTSAGSAATSMVPGWNNRVTQVFIS